MLDQWSTKHENDIVHCPIDHIRKDKRRKSLSVPLINYCTDDDASTNTFNY